MRIQEVTVERGGSAPRDLFSDLERRAASSPGRKGLTLRAFVELAEAWRITEALRIPTIGIGAGPHRSGQVLVWHDLLGINTDFGAKFVKRFAEVGEETRRGLEAFASEVRAGTYPADEHSYHISDAEYALFESEIAPGVLVADDWL